MTPRKLSSIAPVFLAFLAGAAAGAVVMALTTPKSGPRLRKDLKDLASRAKQRVEDVAEKTSEAWDEMRACAVLAADDLKYSASVSANDPSV